MQIKMYYQDSICHAKDISKTFRHRPEHYHLFFLEAHVNLFNLFHHRF